MRTSRVTVIALLVIATLYTAPPASPKGPRRLPVRDGDARTVPGVGPNVADPATWIEKRRRFWYRRSVKGGTEFVLVDADTQEKRPPFDHEKLAASLSTALEAESLTGVTLPFKTSRRRGRAAIEVTVSGTTWRCALDDYRRANDPPTRRPGGRRGGACAEDLRAEIDVNAVAPREDARTESRGAGQELQRGVPRNG